MGFLGRDAGPEAVIGPDDLELFDLLAGYTRLADGAFDLLRKLCADDDRLAVPPMVTNQLRGREEPIG